MAWTAPKTWITGEALTAALQNQQLRDNMLFLFDRPEDSYEADEAADYTENSTSFVDVDTTNFSFTITSSGAHTLVGFHGTVSNNTIGAYINFDIEIDGVRIGGPDGIIGGKSTAAGDVYPVSFARLIPVLSIANHVFRLQWKVSAGTATLYAGAGTANLDLFPQFWVHEL